jgi:phospholipid N-methyltransferase
MSESPTNGSHTDAAKKRKRGDKPDWVLMAKKFLQQGTTIASFAPSSSYLSRTIIRGINFDDAKVIVELGAGTGPVTTELAKRAKPGTRLLIIEQDPDFCTRLRDKFPTFDVIQGDAGKLEEYLDERGLDHADHVISGLPLPSFSTESVDTILDASHRRLKPGGTYRQLSCMPWVFWPWYKQFFKELKFLFVPWNLPPAGVYLCRGYISRTKPTTKPVTAD